MLVRRTKIAPEQLITFQVNGQFITARSGESVAFAALAAGVMPTRNNPVSGSPRAPYCLMGICFECLMTIDGVENRQSCMIPVAEGMVVYSQDNKASLERLDDD